MSWAQQKKLPAPGSLALELDADPAQTPASEAPFDIERGGVTYTVTPLYDYDLYGLVVSDHNARGGLDISHKRWEDNLNVKDLCVLWGVNARTGIYRKMKFKSGDFTCYYQTRDPATFQAFDTAGMSNNHMLAGDDATARAVLAARRGDQVHFTGFLAEYTHGGGFRRGTSISREDTGKHACETVYVTGMEIIRRGNPLWRAAYKAALALCVISLLLLGRSLFAGPSRES